MLDYYYYYYYTRHWQANLDSRETATIQLPKCTLVSLITSSLCIRIKECYVEYFLFTQQCTNMSRRLNLWYLSQQHDTQPINQLYRIVSHIRGTLFVWNSLFPPVLFAFSCLFCVSCRDKALLHFARLFFFFPFYPLMYVCSAHTHKKGNLLSLQKRYCSWGPTIWISPRQEMGLDWADNRLALSDLFP